MQRLKNRTFCIRDLEENHFSRSFFAHHSANVQVANYLDDRKSIIICTTIPKDLPKGGLRYGQIIKFPGVYRRVKNNIDYFLQLMALKDFLVSILYTQIFQQLFWLADHKYGGSLPVPVHFLMDEFANETQL